MLKASIQRWLVAFSLFLSVANAQEKPFYRTPQYTKNVTHRTYVCDRFQEYANGTRELKTLLEGLPLSVGVLDQENDIFFRLTRPDLDDPDTWYIREEDPGIASHILDELARRGKFTWRNSYALVQPPKTKVYNPDRGRNYTWTDVLLDSVIRYDISFGEWVHNHERRQLGISFPTGWMDASAILVQNEVKKVSEFEMEAFLRPFSSEVWYLICAVIFFSGVIYWIIDKIEYPNDKINTVVYDTFLTTLTFTQHHQYWDPSTHGKRIFGYSAAFWALILASSYTANQASFLVAQQKPVIIAETLDQVSKKKLTLCVRAEAAVHNQIQGKYNDTIKYQPQPEYAAVYKDLLDGNCDMMAARSADFDAFRNDKDKNPNCSLTWVGRAQFLNPAGAGTFVDTSEYCTSAIRHVLDVHMSEMQADGTIERLWEAHLRSLKAYRQCKASNLFESQTLDGQYALTVTDLGGVFVFHGILIAIAIFVTIIESPWRRKRHRKKAARKAAEEESEVGGDDDYGDYKAMFQPSNEFRPSMERLHSNRSMKNLVGAEMSNFYQTYSDKDDSFTGATAESKIRESIRHGETYSLPADGLLSSLEILQSKINQLHKRAEAQRAVDTSARVSRGPRLAVIDDINEDGNANSEDDFSLTKKVDSDLSSGGNPNEGK